MKHTLALFIAIFTMVGAASGESALSALGHGLVVNSSSIRANGMGGVSLALVDSLSLNLRTPALWQGSATARFTVQAGWARNQISDPNGVDNGDDFGFSGAALAMPVGETAFVGVALSPYTRVNYRWKMVGTAGWSSTLERHQGRGGLTQAVVGMSVPSILGGRAGVGVRAIIGRIDRLWSIEYPDISARSAGATISDRFKGVGWHLSLKRDWGDWSGGFSFNSPIRLTIQEQVVITAGSTTQLDTTLTLADKWETPFDASLGVGRRFGRHLMAIEIALDGWGMVNEPPELDGAVKDAWRFSAGWEYAPTFRPFDPFWRALTYRSGLVWSQHYGLTLNNKQPVKLAAASGISLPFNRGRSRLDVALEFSWLGDKATTGVGERSFGITIAVANSEYWFLSRRDRH